MSTSAPSEPTAPAQPALPAPPVTLVEVVYPPHRGKIGLRGSHAPLSWEHTQPPDEIEGDRSLFRVPLPPDEVLEIKLVRNEEEWAAGRNYGVHAGDHLVLEPCFDRTKSRVEGPFEIDAGGHPIKFEVLLPPSYDEQETREYPVVYAQDGQSLWSTSQDPYGIWHLDDEVDHLYELGAIEELILVAIHTSDERVERLSPTPDPKYGGGKGPEHLAALLDHLLPHIDENFRTRTEPEDTCVLGSSMGGLFSFYAAWERPDVFGKAACLSSSFWWANRWLVRHVQRSRTPTPKPIFYIDSGAPIRSMETDPSARDGFHDTRSMFRALSDHAYTPGVDMNWLVFTNAKHNADAWRARIAIPLQILFPPKVRRPEAAKRERRVRRR
jgi:enterochelin esterase-like enzyme